MTTPWLATSPADYDTQEAAHCVQPSLFGATLPGPGELPGQGSLLGADDGVLTSPAAPERRGNSVQEERNGYPSAVVPAIRCAGVPPSGPGDPVLPYGRTFTPERKAQGFRSQAHLDAFYACQDHRDGCGECGQPGRAMWLEGSASWQPAARLCPEGIRLQGISDSHGMGQPVAGREG